MSKHSIPQLEEMGLEIGGRVIVSSDPSRTKWISRDQRGYVGRIVGYPGGETFDVGVVFDGPFPGGHQLLSRDLIKGEPHTEDRGYWFRATEIEPFPEEPPEVEIDLCSILDDFQ